MVGVAGKGATWNLNTMLINWSYCTDGSKGNEIMSAVG